MKIKTDYELKKLFKTTNFAKGKNPTWDAIQVKKLKPTQHDDYRKEDLEFGHTVHVPQCSHFGETMISLADTYESSGNDALFLQELVRLYRQGKLVFKSESKENPEHFKWT